MHNYSYATMRYASVRMWTNFDACADPKKTGDVLPIKTSAAAIVQYGAYRSSPFARMSIPHLVERATLAVDALVREASWSRPTG